MGVQYIIKIKMVQVEGRHLRVSFLYDFYHQQGDTNYYICLYHPLLMRLDFTVVEVLDFSLSVPILLEHPVICRQNVANKNNINNFFNKSSYMHKTPYVTKQT